MDLSDVEEDLSPADAPFPDWSDSETESYPDTPSGSPQLGQTDGEQEQHQECSQEEERGCPDDSVPYITVGSEVGHKLCLRLKRDRRDGPEENPEEGEEKRGKTRMFSTYELEELEKAYKRDPYPDSSDKDYLATRLKISLRRVKVWFQNRRRKGLRPGEQRPKRKERSSKDGDERGGKRRRERFSLDQVREMEKVFKQFPYPETHVRDDLAMRFKVKPDRVRVWFQNRRNKWKTGEKPGRRVPERRDCLPGPPLSLVQQHPVQFLRRGGAHPKALLDHHHHHHHLIHLTPTHTIPTGTFTKS
ncbi:homeobox protein GBX-2-like [Branchiostoma floridae]|uniref:Homeobox protein GBX-2-like n=1 Tax=Branchiostoma floridae TaxID=7739 RepID=A0A9J7KY46_BRAFL|nr:homeobox protein GBX-2-like [Branchiostoma floridae]